MKLDSQFERIDKMLVQTDLSHIRPLMHIKGMFLFESGSTGTSGGIYKRWRF
jgi:hypothetical protein